MSPSNEDLWISVIRLKFWKCFVPRVHTCPINLLTSDRSFLLQEVEEREEPLAGATLTNFQLQTLKRQSFQGLKGDSRRPSTVSKTCSRIYPHQVFVINEEYSQPSPLLRDTSNWNAWPFITMRGAQRWKTIVSSGWKIINP